MILDGVSIIIRLPLSTFTINLPLPLLIPIIEDLNEDVNVRCPYRRMEIWAIVTYFRFIQSNELCTIFYDFKKIYKAIARFLKTSSMRFDTLKCKDFFFVAIIHKEPTAFLYATRIDTLCVRCSFKRKVHLNSKP